MGSEHLVLVGMMAAGKTTVGRAVAARLGRPFSDSDELVEARTGRTVREIFARDGEAAFRVLETAALVEALAVEEPQVIAAAGGVVLEAANRSALRRPGVRVVWLRADPHVLEGRLEAAGGPGHRPLLDGDPGAALRRLAAEREPLYREVADVVVDVGGLTPGDVVERVLSGETGYRGTVSDTPTTGSPQGQPEDEDKGLLQRGVQAAADLAKSGIEATRDVVNTGTEATRDMLQTSAEASRDVVSSQAEAARDATASQAEAARSAVPDAADAAREAGQASAGAAADVAQSGAEATRQAGQAGAGAAGDVAQSGAEAAGQAGQAGAEAAGQAGQAEAGAAGDTAEATRDAANRGTSDR